MYVDSCILVKLLTPEGDSAFFDQALSGQPLTTSELTFTEVRSALLAKERMGHLPSRDRESAWRQFLRWIDEEQIVLEPLDSPILKKATRILDACHPSIPLRTLDAIHLATADITQETPICSTDRRVLDAATHLGLEVLTRS